MIVDVINDDMLTASSHKYVAFGINTEGVLRGEFAREICNNYALGFSVTGKRELGEIIIIQTGLTKYYGIVCYSLENGWNDSPKILADCLNRIETLEKEKIAVYIMDSEFFTQMADANLNEIIKAIHLSQKQCVVYCYIYSKKEILDGIE